MIMTVKEVERKHLSTILEKTGWDLEKTECILKIPVSQVKRKIKEHGLKKPGA